MNVKYMKSFSDKILILDNVLSHDDCTKLIEFYNKVGPSKQHRDTFVLSIEPAMEITETVLKITSAFHSFFNCNINIGWCEIVEWPEKSFQPVHRDTFDPNTNFTSITYLNTSYSGGKTFFIDDIEIIPKVGRTVYFDGTHYEHGVSKVNNGVRYTLPIWYNAITG